jgi:hypothetical protein
MTGDSENDAKQKGRKKKQEKQGKIGDKEQTYQGWSA